MDLIKKYGCYKVRKGTRLYRHAKGTNHYEIMFFGFCRLGTLGASHHSDIQIWEVIEDFDALFMIKGKNRGEHLLSAIVDIYNSYFPQNKKDDWDFVKIKQTDVERNPLINKLRADKITQWVCSVENLPPMEVCLFESLENNQQLVRFLYCLKEGKEDELEGLDSFDSKYLENISLEYVHLKTNPQWDIIIYPDDEHNIFGD